MKRRTLLKLVSTLPLAGFLGCSVFKKQDAISWIESNIKITIPTKSESFLIKLSNNQKDYIKTVENENKIIVLKDRQIGLSTANYCWNIYNCLHNKNMKSAIVSNIYHMSARSFNLICSILTQSNIKFNSGRCYVKFENGSIIQFKSYKDIESDESFKYITLDEAAFADIEVTSNFGKIPCNKMIVQSSLPSSKYVRYYGTSNINKYSTINNWFYKIHHDAELNKNDFVFMKLYS